MPKGFWFLIVLVLLSGCNAATDRTAAPPTLAPQDGGFLQPPGGALEARRLLARELNVAAQSIVIQSIDSIEWQDTCLEVGEPGETCEPQQIPGLQVTLRYAGNTYVFHTDLDGSLVRQIRLVDQPSTDAMQAIQYLAGLLGFDPTVIQLLSERPVVFADGCLEIAIAEIPCTQLPVEGRIIRLGVEERIYEFRTASIAPTPVLALVDGLSTSVSALNWSREGSAQEFCDGLKIYLNGWIVQYNCRGQASQNPGILRLSPENQSRLLKWFVSLQPFEFNQSGLDGSLVRMTFNGIGLGDVDASLQVQISEYAAGLLAPIQKGTVTPLPFP